MERSDQERGTAEVHSHLGLGPHDRETRSRERYDDTPFGMDDVNLDDRGGRGGRARAEEMISRARARAAELGSPAGVVDRVREHPLVALGVAAAVGFLLAGRTDPRTPFGRLKKRFRGTLVAGLTATLLEEAREIFGDEEMAGLSDDLFAPPPPRRKPPRKRARPRPRKDEE